VIWTYSSPRYAQNEEGADQFWAQELAGSEGVRKRAESDVSMPSLVGNQRIALCSLASSASQIA